MSKKSKVFISGGAGFIGYHLTLKLLELDHKVLIYDNFINYLPPLLSNYDSKLHFRLESLRDKVEVIRGNVCNKYHLNQAINSFNPDVIIDLTAVPVVKLANEFFEDSVSNNLLTVCALLESIQNLKGSQQFIFISSSYIYGDFVKDPVEENDISRPKDIYGGTKYCGEILTESFSRMHGNIYTIIRPCAAYGATDANMRIVATFIKNAMENQPLLLKGNVDSRIDFTYIDDLVSGIALCVGNEKAFNQTFNLSYGHARSINDLANIVCSFFPNAMRRHEGRELNALERGTLSIEKAKSLLGYRPEYSLEQGVEAYLAFIQSHEGMI